MAKNQEPRSGINIPDPQHWYLEVRIVHEWVEEVCSLDEVEPRLVRQGCHKDSVPGGMDRPQVGRRSL
jgi:hypothetical protein